jgi:hypothetical protein
MMADAARQWLGERGLTPMKDVAMAVSDYFRPDVPPYAVIRPQTESDEQGARIGRLVAQLARGERVPMENQLAPVRLDVPERV